MTRRRPGYTWEHDKARAAALAELARAPGTACPYCGHPMSADMALDLDHYPPLAIPLPAGCERLRRLAHRSCNRRAGQAISAARRRVQRARGTNSHAW